MSLEEPNQSHRFMTELSACGHLGACAVVALIEEQVERALHANEPCWEIDAGEFEQRT